MRYRQGAGAAIVVPQARDRADENIVRLKVSPELSPAPQITEIMPALPFEQKERPVSAHAWMSELSRNTGMPIVAPAPEAGNVVYTVLYVSADGAVADKGRTLTLYPFDALQNLRDGDAVTVSSDALLRRVTARTIENDKGERQTAICIAFPRSWCGHLMVDDYAGYKGGVRRRSFRVACLANIRCKFFDVHAAGGGPVAEQALQRIAKL